MSVTNPPSASGQAPNPTPDQLQALAQVLGGQAPQQPQGQNLQAMQQALAGYLGSMAMAQGKKTGIVQQLQNGSSLPTQGAGIGSPTGVSALDFMNTMTP